MDNVTVDIKIIFYVGIVSGKSYRKKISVT